jgi:two-component system, OmpR family, sensor kinase
VDRLPIRVRLTAAFALAMLLVLVAAAAFVYSRQRSSLTETIDHGLERRSDDVAAVVRRPDTGLHYAGAGRLTDPEDTFIQFLTPSGHRVEGTKEVGIPALSVAETHEASRHPATFESELPHIEGTARMLARPLALKDRRLVLVVGISLADRDEALSSLVRSFLIGIPIAVLLASGIGYALARAGLGPVEAMRRRATRVSLDRGSERLPLPAAHDEIRRLGETLNEMLARLEDSFQRERRFVADASHELRTPLAVLKAELEAAVRIGGDDLEVRKSLVVALEETDHLAQLSDDLLLIARAADGRLPVRPERVDVRELLERTRDRFEDRAIRLGREIRVEAPEGESVSVDPLRARQALGNLVDNALRHGGGEIRLSARRSPNGVEIDVTDDGDGFPAELEGQMFERFTRGDGKDTRSGAGLGLAIVRAIAEAHGATATIVSSDSAGATVRLRFPPVSELASPT